MSKNYPLPLLILDAITWPIHALADRADRAVVNAHKPINQHGERPEIGDEVTCPRCRTPWPCPTTKDAMDRILARPAFPPAR